MTALNASETERLRKILAPKGEVVADGSATGLAIVLPFLWNYYVFATGMGPEMGIAEAVAVQVVVRRLLERLLPQ